jgi:hypothetical protein
VSKSLWVVTLEESEHLLKDLKLKLKPKKNKWLKVFTEKELEAKIEKLAEDEWGMPAEMVLPLIESGDIPCTRAASNLEMLYSLLQCGKKGNQCS